MQLPSSAGVSWVPLLWLALDLGFLLALLIHLLGGPGGPCSPLYSVFQDAIRFGKTKAGSQRPAWLHCFDVPKRWFSHFYIISVMWNGVLLWVFLQTSLLGFKIPEWIESLLHLLGVDTPHVQGEDLSTILALFLMWLHSFRRLMECFYVSVFSDGVIHLAQYCFGLGFYFLLGITIFSQARLASRTISFGDLLMQSRWYHGFGLILYTWASIHQNRVHVILANLRKNKSGKITNLKHVIPHGDWFENVSCPHYFAELLIYVSISAVFGFVNAPWWLVVLCVLFNQALAAVLSHEFYHEKFKLYPAQRKAFIPFIF
uniref:Polyprenal reductase n=1 Tax=Leptobrachium leishanense TaxID=445787 RepID=A0A8C5M0S7_9ANUR